MVFLACDKMSQEVFAAIGELIMLTSKSLKRDLILSGKVGIIPSTERTMAEGHSQLQCTACQSIQVIVEKILI